MIGFDTESFKFGPHLKIPRTVCVSIAGRGNPPPLTGRVGWVEDIWYYVIHAKDFDFEGFKALAAGGFVAHNAGYDLCALARLTGDLDWLFDRVEDLTARCTLVREKLLLLAHDKLDYLNGRKTEYSLAALVSRYFGVDISEGKTDPNAWRLRYGELYDVPMGRWPDAALEYAGMDAVWALRIYEAQVERWPSYAWGWPLVEGDRVVSEDRELAAMFAFDLHSAWGTRTNPAKARSVVEDWRSRSASGKAAGVGAGFIRPNGSVNKKVLQQRVQWALGDDTPMTERPKKASAKWAPQIRINHETIEKAAAVSGDKALQAYADSMQSTLFLSRYGEPLILGSRAALTHSYNTLLNTGRTSAYDWPAQQPPRIGDFRACFEPREGFLYCGADYDFIELCALGQVQRWVVGQSRLADVIDAGMDPHINTALPMLAASGLVLTYDQAVELRKAKDPRVSKARQDAKPVNFGFPGMMGPSTFVEYAWNSYKMQFTLDQAKHFRTIWTNEYPEIWPYWRWVESQTARGGIQQFVSERIRGGATGPAAANSYFQGLVADGAKYATWLLVRACYTGTTDKDAPSEVRDAAVSYRGARVVLMLHDEIIAEVPELRARECAEAQRIIMHYAMKLHIPDVRVGCKPVLTRRWIKGADPTYDPQGRLTVTE